MTGDRGSARSPKSRSHSRDGTPRKKFGGASARSRFPYAMMDSSLGSRGAVSEEGPSRQRRQRRTQGLGAGGGGASGEASIMGFESGGGIFALFTIFPLSHVERKPENPSRDPRESRTPSIPIPTTIVPTVGPPPREQGGCRGRSQWTQNLAHAEN